MVVTTLAYLPYGSSSSRVAIVIGLNNGCTTCPYNGHPSSKGGTTNLDAAGYNSNEPEVPREKRAEDVSFAISSLMQDIAPHQTDKEHHYAESIPS